MDTARFEILAERVDRLEHQNLWLKRFGAFMLIGMGALVVGSARAGRPAERVEAEQFVVKDARGQSRASLGVNEDGQPLLTMFDEEGREQIELGMTFDQGSSLVFRNRGRTKLALTSSSQGHLGLNLYDSDAAVAAGIYLQPDRESGLVMNRGAGGMHLSVDREGSAQLRIADTEGKPLPGFEGGTASGLSSIGAPGPEPAPVFKPVSASLEAGPDRSGMTSKPPGTGSTTDAAPPRAIYPLRRAFYTP